MCVYVRVCLYVCARQCTCACACTCPSVCVFVCAPAGQKSLRVFVDKALKQDFSANEQQNFLRLIGYMKTLDTNTIVEAGIDLQNERDEEKGGLEKGSAKDRLKQTGLVTKIGTRGRVKVEASPFCLCLRAIAF